MPLDEGIVLEVGLAAFLPGEVVQLGEFAPLPVEHLEAVFDFLLQGMGIDFHDGARQVALTAQFRDDVVVIYIDCAANDPCVVHATPHIDGDRRWLAQAAETGVAMGMFRGDAGAVEEHAFTDLAGVVGDKSLAEGAAQAVADDGGARVVPRPAVEGVKVSGVLAAAHVAGAVGIGLDVATVRQLGAAEGDEGAATGLVLQHHGLQAAAAVVDGIQQLHAVIGQLLMELGIAEDGGQLVAAFVADVTHDVFHAGMVVGSLVGGGNGRGREGQEQ